MRRAVGISLLLSGLCLLGCLAGCFDSGRRDADPPATGKGADFAAQTVVPSDGEWPLYRGNALQTGVATSQLPGTLEVLWKFETKDSIEGTAAIAGGTVYVGSMDKYLYALNLADGKEKWKYEAAPIKAPASYHDGSVYVGDTDGVFHRVNARGEKVWADKTGGEISSGANFDGEGVLFGAGDENLYRLSQKDGKELWTFKVEGGPVMGTPAVVGGRTFAAGCDSTLHVIDLKTGKEEGKGVELSGQVGSAAAVGGDRLFVGTMSDQVQAVDWKSGEVVWTYEAEKRAQPFYASVALTDKLVLAGSRDNRLHALDRDKGTEVWSYLTGGKVDSSPVVSGGRVYFGSIDGNLYVLDLKGALVQKIDLGSAVLGSPAVGGGRLVIGTDKGVVYCLGAKN
jgi:outer membrane protein assembly factor BamB